MLSDARIGERIIDYIGKAAMLTAECVQCDDGTTAHVFVWTANSTEQLGALCRELAREADKQG